MVKFISYSGKYPNLCSGDLILEIDGIQHKLDRPLTSGGSVSFDIDWSETVESGVWDIELPQHLEIYREQIEDVINDSIKHGCCGGCV